MPKSMGSIITQDGKRYEVPERTPEELREIFRPCGTELGSLVYSWNRLHETLSALFEAIVKSETPQLPLAIWHSTDNDSAQRKMLRAATEAAIHLPGNVKDRIVWILNTIDDPLRFKRNDALHAPLAFITGVVNDAVTTWVHADVFSASPRAKALREKNLIKEFKEYAEMAIMLAEHSGHLLKAIGDPTYALPGKPSLPHAHRKRGL
jgi:hypothetical protein